MVDTPTSDRKKEKITDTDTTKENSPHKLSKTREIPATTQGIIPSVNQTTADGVLTSGRDLHAVRAVINKEIVTGTTRSAAGFLKDPPEENVKEIGGTIPVDRNTVGIPPEPLPKFGLVLDPLPYQLS